MKIQAINSANAVTPCQPIKPDDSKGFFKSSFKPAFSRKDPMPIINIAVLETPDVKVSEEKFDMACQLAAYYKSQYENLLKDGGIIV